ncbi:MAG: glucuronate isomerase [Treponema sp.]|nr:glucuronate isomerase [Treponema sp.]
MKKKFMDENFLLENETARNLYEIAKKEPIYDYHCHLIPREIAENKPMSDIGSAWLSGDHYKWRMMRAMGINEENITGNGSNYEKYCAWVRAIENLIGNPLYHWTHLELQRYFNINDTLTEKRAREIWDKANDLLKTPELSIKGIFAKFNIHAVGTTDDPADSLEYHKAIAQGTAAIGNIETKVIPTFRPDKALYLNAQDFGAYIVKLSEAAKVNIKNVNDVLSALEKRLDFFITHGCRASDHALEYPPYAVLKDSQIDDIFKRALAGKNVTREEADAYAAKILTALSGLYSKKNIVMQLHFSSIRNVNGNYFKLLGANTGYDAVCDNKMSENLARLLDAMNTENANGLPKTIFYTLNPKDYYPILTVMGGFQDSSCAGKMQLGSAWWFCDHKDGMEEQMKALASLGLFPAFVGMLTDSRSFLSYPRHEYFRRIMCNLIGKWVENGEFPDNSEKLESIVRDISFTNALRYFG